MTINEGLNEMSFIDEIIILPDFLEVIYTDGHLSIHGFTCFRQELRTTIDSIVAKPAGFVYLENQELVARAISLFPLRLFADIGKDAAVDI